MAPPSSSAAVTNPYAKKRKLVIQNPTANSVAAANGRNSTPNPSSTSDHRGRGSSAGGFNINTTTAASNSAQSLRVVLGGGGNDNGNVGDALLGHLEQYPTTFSQAFASLDGETTAQRSTTATGDDRISEQEAAERRAINFNHSTTAASASATTTTLGGTEGAGATGDVRDFHMQLQPHVLYVSTRQRGNGLLKYIRNVPFAFSQMLPDYIVSPTTCALFLSIKYHQLYPNYIHRRLGELRTDFRVRILLVLVDVDDNANSLLQLNKLGVTNGVTVILTWSDAEAARYLESYKSLEGRDATSIQKRESTNVADQMTDFITACKPCSKTDAASLWQQFGSLSAIANPNTTTRDELSLCPGLGPIKVQRLWDAFHKPFSKKATRLRKKKKLEQQQQQQQVEAAKSDSEEQSKVVVPAVPGDDDKAD